MEAINAQRLRFIDSLLRPLDILLGVIIVIFLLLVLVIVLVVVGCACIAVVDAASGSQVGERLVIVLVVVLVLEAWLDQHKRRDSERQCVIARIERGDLCVRGVLEDVTASLASWLCFFRCK